MLKVKRDIITILLVLLMSIDVSGQQTVQRISSAINVEMQFLLYLPSDYNENPGQSYPLLLFLHGGGEGGNDISKVKTHGPPKLIEKGKEFPFIVVSPQNPNTSGFWNESAVMAVLDHVADSYRVDRHRVHLAGMSRGGYGAWRVAMLYPHRFASLTAICGVAPAFYAHWLKDLPVWVFHGDQDNVIPVSESDNIVERMKANGQNVRYTRYEGVGHDAWTPTFNNPELYQWMLEQRRDVVE